MNAKEAKEIAVKIRESLLQEEISRAILRISSTAQFGGSEISLNILNGIKNKFVEYFRNLEYKTDEVYPTNEDDKTMVIISWG